MDLKQSEPDDLIVLAKSARLPAAQKPTERYRVGSALVREADAFV